MTYSVTIDVPSIDEGLIFYRDAMGLEEVARPMPTYAILRCGEGRIGLMQKAAGSKPAPGSEDVRRYKRHWTPVHIDFHDADFENRLQTLLNAGAKCERQFPGSGGRPPVAFCSDPFGNGFCLLGSAS